MSTQNQSQRLTSNTKTEKEILDAQNKVMELAQSIYALIKDNDIALGMAHDALDVALILKRRTVMP